MGLLRVGVVAIVAGSAVAAIYPGLVYNLDRMLTETLFVFLTLAFVFMLMQYRRNGSLWAIIIAATAIGAAIQVRSQALPFAVFGLIMCAAFGRGASRRKITDWPAPGFVDTHLS